MNSAPGFVIAVSALFLGSPVSAQDLSRYRGYALESTLESVISISRARATDVTTLHTRPANIQELEWRAPYVSAGSTLADPVGGIAFTFFNDALYQVVVSYDTNKAAFAHSGMDFVIPAATSA